MSKKVTGTYKKSRTKGMGDPDPKRRGAAAFNLLKDIDEARRLARRRRQVLKKDMADHKEAQAFMKKEGITDEENRHYYDMIPRASYHQKVDANRQVQALKKKYDSLSEPEKEAGRKMMMRKAKGKYYHSTDWSRRHRAEERAMDRLSRRDAQEKAKSELKAKKKSK